MDVIKIICPNCRNDLMVKNRMGVEDKTFICPSCQTESLVRDAMCMASIKLDRDSHVNVTHIVDYNKLYQSDYTDYDIFISYSRSDYAVVKDFLKEFEKEGFRVWIDKDGIESGDAFKSTIVSAIEKSKVFLFFSSEASNKSEWTAKEIGIANARKKPIIPIKLDDSQYNKNVEFDLINLDYIDYVNKQNRRANIAKLIRTLNTKVEKIIDIKDKQEADDEKRDTFLKRNKRGCTITFSVMLCALALFVPTWVVFNHSAGSGNAYDNATPSIAENEFMPIDLGLPSGTLWANMNIGAESPSDFGDLFAFGETYTREDYTENLYLIGKRLNPNICRSTYDVAKRQMGEEWSLPTISQYQELISQCRWTWTKYPSEGTATDVCAKCNGSGFVDKEACKVCNGSGMVPNEAESHWGYQIVGKNGNSIFLPAGGWKCSPEFQYQNKYGYYWTCEQVANKPGFAKGLYISSGEHKLGDGYMFYGRSVRAVYVPDIAVAE